LGTPNRNSTRHPKDMKVRVWWPLFCDLELAWRERASRPRLVTGLQKLVQVLCLGLGIFLRVGEGLQLSLEGQWIAFCG
jgi:hypothetical protein